jgi:Mn2+/Fe2+ NRAMP family transporter
MGRRNGQAARAESGHSGHATVVRRFSLVMSQNTSKWGVVNPVWLKLLAYTVAVIIGGLNIWLLIQFFGKSVS